VELVTANGICTGTVTIPQYRVNKTKQHWRKQFAGISQQIVLENRWRVGEGVGEIFRSFFCVF
jgi:hypothetical protein